MATTQLHLHLIPNAHLDPVWLWDWREGYTEMINTTRTVLDLMDEFPDLTFSRGEAFLYRQVEENAPDVFQRLKLRIAEGRWDVVGGTMLQSDMNIPATETFVRHLLYAQRYFQNRFGLKARSGWSADCFGHSVALPDLLAAGGMEYYSYTRPGGVPPYNTFWWEGPAGGRLLVHRPLVGWYGTERHELPDRLDGQLKLTDPALCLNRACFMGLGNHGGHPTRRMIAEVRDWIKTHPQVTVSFSTLTRFFDALRKEVNDRSDKGIPVFKGEINFAPRGIYSAAARFKFAYRKSEALVSRAERMAALIRAAGTPPVGLSQASIPDLQTAWEAILFNTFHDILPGSSIERAYDEQLDWLAQAPHAARTVEHCAIRDLAATVDTRVRPPSPDMPAGLPLLLFNPHPWPYKGPVELEGGLDYRPIWKYQDRVDQLPVTVLDPESGALPLQKIDTENFYAQTLNLRTRVIVPVELPAMGWKVVEFAYDEGARDVPVPAPVQVGENSIRGGEWVVQAAPGDLGIRILRAGKPLLDVPGLSALTIEDPWGTWGDFAESVPSQSLTEVREVWRVTKVEVGERGPLRATLNVRMEAGRSRLDLTLSLWVERDVLDISARVFWDERCARLKLVLPGRFSHAEYDVMGGTIRRGSLGEVPGGRWVKLDGPGHSLGFASDALYGFNLTPEGDLQATIVRATRYAADLPAKVEEHPWRPVLDVGELRFHFLLTPETTELERLAAELEQPPLAMHVIPSSGKGPKTGGFMSLAPESVRVLAIKPAEDRQGWILRFQSFAAETVVPEIQWMGQALMLDSIRPRALATYRFQRAPDGKWQATPVNLFEQTLAVGK
jgi:alpha-mannosidase